MTVTLTKVPIIAEEQRTPLVCLLLELIRERDEYIQQLRDSLAVIKGEKPRPEIKPSLMEKGAEGSDDANADSKDGKRPGSEKRSKTSELKIHETLTVPPETVPPGSRFQGYDDYIVQDLVITPRNIRYRLERWLTPEGSYVTGKLPDYLEGAHFGPTLISYILYQHHHNMVNSLEKPFDPTAKYSKVATEPSSYSTTITLLSEVNILSVFGVNWAVVTE